MRVYLDTVIFDLQKSGGISVYFYELIQRMLAHDLDLRLIERGREENTNIFRKKLALPAERQIREGSRVPALVRYLPVRLPLEKGAIFHSSYYRSSPCRDVANVITVYDFTYEYHMHGPRRWLHSLQKKLAIDRADGIICISENTRRDLLRLHPRTDPAKVTVIHLAASEDFRKLPEGEVFLGLDGEVLRLLDERFVLYVGTREKYKNFEMAVATLAKLPAYKLVAVGGGAFSEKERQLLEQCVSGRYLHLPGISTRVLNVLYNSAFCLLYPSSYEGFGIPILEAMQSGCPVVTTDKTSIPEVCGAAGLTVSEISVECFVAKIESLMDQKYRNSVIAAGFRQAEGFSWDATYRRTLAFYAKVAQTKPAS